jgi:carboxyl-terminal processing protease
MKRQKSYQRYRFNLLGCLTALVFILLLQPTLGFTQEGNNASKGILDDELLENISLLSEVLAHIQQNHLDSPDSEPLMYGAIRGMLRTLDPYSQFFPPENYANFRTESRGTYGGLGMEIGIRDDRLTIISPFKGTPADKAGLQSGDIISQIENRSTTNMTTTDAVEHLRGEPGTQVTITIVREGEPRPLEVTLTRDVIQFPSVESKVLKENIGYIRINQFRDNTASDVDKVFETFNQQEIEGLILDLRSNPGGLLRAAVEIASDFVGPGQLIVYTEGKTPREEYSAEKGKQQKRYPLIVLVNGGSASASEIVAGAIKDHGRGLVMGEKTFGKASVQQIFPLSGGAAVKLTVAHYYSPNGVDIHKIGIVPDIEDPWFSRSEIQMLRKLQNHKEIKDFIEKNGDDILSQLEKAQHASKEDTEAASLLRTYQRLVDLLTAEGIILSNVGLKLAIARETENDIDEYEYDPRIIRAIDQLRVFKIYQSTLKTDNPE